MLAKLDRAHILLGLLVLLGIGWRAISSDAPAPPSARDSTAISEQISRVAERRKKREPRPRKAPLPGRMDSTAGPLLRQESAPAGALPPGAVLRQEARRPTLVDMDKATKEEIESLPRIGPALAARIVADRAANGPFGSMEGLTRVRGVGPAMAAQLAERVTFGTTGRPSNVLPPTPRKPGRRRAVRTALGHSFNTHLPQSGTLQA